MRFQTELNALPGTFQKIIIPLLSFKTTEDQFHDMVLCCYEEYNKNRRGFAERVNKVIAENQKEKRKETFALYNPYRNISFDQCYGTSDIPASVWLKLPDHDEWADPLAFEDD